MIKTISLFDFREAFKQCGRENQFSYDALEVLFDHLEGLEFDLSEQIELDVVALCCEYSEETWQEIANNYLLHDTSFDDEGNHEKKVIAYLEDEGVFVGTTHTSIIYRQH
jgi:hypothetical protein